MTKARIAMLAFTSVIMIALEGSTAVAQLAGDGVCDRRGYAILSPWDLSSFPLGRRGLMSISIDKQWSATSMRNGAVRDYPP